MLRPPHPLRAPRSVLPIHLLVPTFVLAVSGCGSTPEGATPEGPSPATSAEADAPDEAGTHQHQLSATAGPGFTEADVKFMQMMIVHHAQAIVMAEMAPTHGASARLLALTRKIEISQEDEIELMERWLRDRDQPVPTEEQIRTMHMPGMLTPDQLAQLDAARGTEFDRLFLEYMIQHHLGAVDMVEGLFAEPGAGQDSEIFRFATDVGADQLDEIGVMETMLEELGPSPRSERR